VTMRTTIDAVLVGRPAAFGPNGEPSGIHKAPVRGPVAVTETGLAGDGQGDTRRHGGPEKAVHHYPTDHYDTWVADRPELGPALEAFGAFGENVATRGLTETDVCVGDVFRLGTAAVQVSHGRQPCWRLNVRFDDAAMAKRVQTTGRTGWYYRVLEPGEVQAGDVLVLRDRPRPAWPLFRLLDLLYRDTRNWDALAEMAALPELTPSWRELAAKRLQRREVEAWTPRLSTPG